MDKMDKLKPCPFCGGAAHVVDVGFLNIDSYEVRCKYNVHKNTGCSGRGPHKPKIVDAIAAWNRRPNERINSYGRPSYFPG
jgi:Lar family restriction alleviation protein